MIVFFGWKESRVKVGLESPFEVGNGWVLVGWKLEIVSWQSRRDLSWVLFLMGTA